MMKQSKEQGNIAVIVALALTALLGLSATVTDLAVLYGKLSHLRNTTDAAALAGAQELAINTIDAEAAARAYAVKNGVEDIDVRFTAHNREIIVTATEVVPLFFARVLGITSKDVAAQSKALIVPPPTLTGIVPLCIDEDLLTYEQIYKLKNGGGDGTCGWYGTLQLSGAGANAYEYDLTYGYSGDLSIGDILEVQTGNMSGPTKDALEARMALDPERINTYLSYTRDAPQILYIPIIDVVSGHADTIRRVQITGFAAFFLEEVSGNGTESIVKGRFLRTIVTEGKSSDSLFDLLQAEQDAINGVTNPDYGLYTVKLLKN